MLGKIGDFFSTAIDTVSEIFSEWSTAMTTDSSSTDHESAPVTVADPDHSYNVGNGFGTTCEGQVFAEANYEFPASDFSSSFGAGSTFDHGSSFDCSSSFSSFTSSWD